MSIFATSCRSGLCRWKRKRSCEAAAFVRYLRDPVLADATFVSVPNISTVNPEIPKPERPLSPTYNPELIESGWYEWWEQKGYFDPKENHTSERDAFTMILPPPNVTGTLHCGHALTTSIQDTIARWHRMNGRSVWYIPGTDHAGIATQTVVEKRLFRDQGVTRHELGREKFLEEVWKWKHKYGTTIDTQHVSY